MQIELSDEMIKVVAGLLRELDHEQLEAVQVGETNGSQAANFFARLEEARWRQQWRAKILKP
jgi:predicted trehalose synthase